MVTLKNEIVLAGMFLLLLSLAGCSEEEGNSLTGNLVAEISTLNIIVTSENGTLLGDAQVYVNGAYEGKTREFGANKGQKKIVLGSLINLVRIRKEGYAPSFPQAISAKHAGAQQMTIALEKRAVDFSVLVRSIESPLKGVLASLTPLENPESGKLYYTDADGKVTFERMDDGNYTLRLSKPGYETKVAKEEVLLSFSGTQFNKTIFLAEVPELIIKVVDEEKNYLPLAEVSIYTAEEYNRPAAKTSLVGFTDSEGEVRFEDALRDADYVLVVKKSGFRAEVREVKIGEGRQYLFIDLNSLIEMEDAEEVGE